MTRLRMVALLAIAAMALFDTGCCSEQKCRTEYDLIKRSECVPGHPPGPIIDIEPNAILPLELVVKRNASVLTPSAVSIFPADPADPCTLRGELIGLRKIRFDFQAGGSFQPAKRVTFQADNDNDGTLDMEIEIRLNGFNTIRWKFTELVGLHRVCVPEPGGEADPLPLEFAHLKKATLKENILGVGTAVKLKVEIP